MNKFITPTKVTRKVAPGPSAATQFAAAVAPKKASGHPASNLGKFLHKPRVKR